MARDNEPGMTKAKKGTSGSGKWTKYKPAKEVVLVEWGDVDVTALALAIDAVTASGAALLLSKSRDGGTLAITICDGDDRMKEYATTADEMSVILREVTIAYK